jgi:hypothetical protein
MVGPSCGIGAVCGHDDRWRDGVFWDTPDDMHWLALAVLLQDEDTGTFRIRRIIFHHDGVADSRENILDGDSIGCKFIIPMVRHHDLLPVY